MDFQTHVSMVLYVCLCLGMDWPWLVGWSCLGFGFVEVAGDLGFEIPPFTNCVDFQTHVSMMPCVCLCVGMVLTLLVGWLCFGFGFIEVTGNLGFDIFL